MTLFKTYSEENCLLECRAKQLFKKCNCLPYYYPRLDLLFAAKLAPKHFANNYEYMKDHDLEGGDDGMYSNNDTENIFESFEESTLFIDRSLKSYTFIYFSKNIGYSICYSRTLIKF